MKFSAPVTRQDVEMLVGAHRAFAARHLEQAAALAKQNAPIATVHKAYDEAGRHLAQVQHWTDFLASMDRPDEHATEGELEGGGDE